MPALIVVVVFALIALVPLGYIWSLNTLFAMGIEFTWTNWLAMFVLNVLVGGTVGASSRK